MISPFFIAFFFFLSFSSFFSSLIGIAYQQNKDSLISLSPSSVYYSLFFMFRRLFFSLMHFSFIRRVADTNTRLWQFYQSSQVHYISISRALHKVLLSSGVFSITCSILCKVGVSLITFHTFQTLV